MSLPWSSKGLKGTPVSADELLILDSADANPSTTNKRITIGSIPPLETFTWTADHDAAGFELLNVGRITLSNPADTFQYLITSSAIALDVTATLPLLTSSDTFVFENFPQPITNKTINENLNSIVQSFPTTGQYLRDNGTNFVASPIINTDLPTGIDPLKIAIPNGDILVGDAVNQGNAVTMSGNATIDNTGVLTIVDNSITNAKTATFTTTKITTTNKSLLNTSIVYNDQNNVLGAFYEDLAEISTPAAPSVGTRRIFVDDSTGEISVRTSSATTISLETQPLVTTDVVVGVQDAANFVYDDTGHQVFGIDNGSEVLAINLGIVEPAGTTYTFTYTIDANDFPTGVSGMVFTQNGLMMSTQVINNDVVSSTVSAKFFINDVEISAGGTSRVISAGNFGLFSGYKRDIPATVGDIFQVKLWTNGSILVDLNKFGVYTTPFIVDIDARIITVNQDNLQITQLIADAPNTVTLAAKNDTLFPDMYVEGTFNIFAAQFPFGTTRAFDGEFLADTESTTEQVQSQNTATNQMFLPSIEGFNLLRVSN